MKKNTKTDDLIKACSRVVNLQYESVQKTHLSTWKHWTHKCMIENLSLYL